MVYFDFVANSHYCLYFVQINTVKDWVFLRFIRNITERMAKKVFYSVYAIMFLSERFSANTILISLLLLFSEDAITVPQGVYLFLGYSDKDESLLKEVTGEGAEDALGAIQGLVSYHNVNANKVSV